MVLSIKLLLASQLSYKKKLQKPSDVLSVSLILYRDTCITPLGYMQHMGCELGSCKHSHVWSKVLGRVLGPVFLNEICR